MPGDQYKSPPHSAELIESSKALFEAMSHPFDYGDTFNPIYYSSSLDFIPDKNSAPESASGISQQIRRELDLSSIDFSSSWKVDIDYDPTLEGLSPSSLSFPVKIQQDTPLQTMTLRRYPGHNIYIPTITDPATQKTDVYKTEAQKIHQLVYDDGKITALPTDLVIQMLHEAGLTLSPGDNPQNWLPYILDKATNWRRTERIVVPQSPIGDQVSLEKTHYQAQSTNGKEYGGVLNYCSEEVTDTGDRQQLRVSFPIVDYSVDIPTVTTRVIHPSSKPSEVASTDGPGSYHTYPDDSHFVQLSPQVLDVIHLDMMDALGDVS